MHGFFLGYALAAQLALVVCSGAASTCLTLYKHNIVGFSQYSRIATRVQPGLGNAGENTIAKLASDFPSTLSGLDAPDVFEYFEKADLAFKVADNAIKGCWLLSGRMWEIGVPSNGNETDSRVSSICAPMQCSAHQVKQNLVPLLFQHNSDSRTLRRASVTELCAWSSLELNFAIIGTECCGTTSLHLNLAQHQELNFRTMYEDGLFTPGGSPVGYEYIGRHRILPFLSQVLEFNNVRWPAVQHPNPGFIRGVCNPRIYSDGFGLGALARVPRVKVVGIACDPLSRFEKLYYYSFCMNVKDATCMKDFTKALRDQSFLDNYGSAFKLRIARASVGPENFKLLHQQWLRKSARAVFDDVARFLGASLPFPSDMKFLRYNSLRGARTGLCRSRALVHLLKKRLEREYKSLEMLFQECGLRVPTELMRRITRCNRPSEASNSTMLPAQTEEGVVRKWSGVS